MKKVLSMVLVAVMLLASLTILSACGSKGIAGKWVAKIDLTKQLGSEADSLAMFGITEDALNGKSVSIGFEFKEDGKFTAAVDMSELKDLMKGFFESLLTSAAQMADMTVDEYVETSGYSSVDEMIDEQINDSFGGAEVEGTYKFENGKLTLTAEESTVEYKVELNGDELKLVEALTSTEEDDSIVSSELLPLSFARQ